MKEKLPDHPDWGEKCTHEDAYREVKTHTRADPFPENPGTPDICEECSSAVREWVQWPCPRAQKLLALEAKVCNCAKWKKGPYR